jgi:hypothetical protein
VIELSPAQVRSLRLRSQHLIGEPASDPTELVRDLFAIQAQDAPAARLALRARGTDFTAADIEQARNKDRTLVRTWVMRGTLHLLCRDDLAWLLPYLAPRLIRQNKRRRTQLGLNETICAKAIPVIRDLLTDEGLQTRAQIAAHLKPLGIPVEGQAVVHLLYLAACEGILCYGPDQDSKETISLLKLDFADESADVLSRLAMHYLHAFAPATREDFAHWAGITLGEARTGFEQVSDELIEVRCEDRSLWMLKEQESWLDQGNALTVKLLPAFDNTLLGYESRAWILPPDHVERIFPGGGILHRALLIDGKIAGTWGTGKTRHETMINVEPFAPILSEVRDALEAETQDIGRFLGIETALSVIGG